MTTHPVTGAPTPSAIVALPGTFCTPAIYDRIRPLLGDRFAMRALSWMTDAPAWTLDDVANWVADQIMEAGPEPILLVGHSTGGAIALRVAITRPELLRGVMLINTGPNMHRHGDVESLIRNMEREGTADVVRAVVDRSFHHAPNAEDYRQLLQYGLDVPVRAALDILRSQHATDFVPELPSVRVPVTVVHGRFDRVRTVDEAQAMASAVPDGRLHVVDAGHSPMYEVPEVVIAALHELDELAAPGRAGLPLDR